MANMFTSLCLQFNAAHNRTIKTVMGSIGNLILAVKAAASAIVPPHGLFTTRSLCILEVDIEETDAVIMSKASAISNIDIPKLFEKSRRPPTNHIINILESPSEAKAMKMTEDSQNMMFELRYDSAGQLTYVENMAGEKGEMEFYNEGLLVNEQPTIVIGSTITSTNKENFVLISDKEI